MGKKKASRRGSGSEELNITSMMDMMTIILVFLLKSYSTEDIGVAPSDDLQLPVSSALKAPKLAVNVVISQRDLLVDGEPVLTLEERIDEASGNPYVAIPEADMRGPLISKLHERLTQKADTSKRQGESAGDDTFDFQGEVLLQCDKRLPFNVIRQVMFTAGQAQFGKFRFVVIKGSG
ncbi:MAG: ExbD/TolR family protein [Myxococcota bacterium]